MSTYHTIHFPTTADNSVDDLSQQVIVQWQGPRREDQEIKR